MEIMTLFTALHVSGLSYRKQSGTVFSNYLGNAGRGNNRVRRPEPRKHHSVSEIGVIPQPEHVVSYS